MRTTRLKYKQILPFIIFLAFFSGNASVLAETAEATDNDAHHAEQSLDWPGLYYGFMPCDDCNGIKTTLALNKNGTYALYTQHMGKSEREFIEKGKFTWGNKDNVIVLTPRKGQSSQQYFVGENVLIKLDEDGNRITGKLAERYVLHRKDITTQPSSHAGH
jgi:copper homeostasis protein (lipoprotein)